MAISPEPSDVRHLLNSCVKLFSPNAEEKQLTLLMDLDKNLPRWVKVDGFRLRQIVMNLLANAIKFTESGYITISSVITETPQSGQADACRSELHISVYDTGAGIAPDRQAAIFEPFIQADDSTARKYGGSGLGLTISKQLVELMGGSIQMISHLGRGSEFTVKIPVDRFDEEADENLVKIPTNLLARCENAGIVKRILVAEDHDVNQVLIGEMLTKLGYDHDLAVDGAEAVAMIRKADMEEKQYDLVLMDLQMPYVDGIKATRMVRGHGIDASALPIVALTANAFDQDVDRCIEAGMQAHLAKPLAMEDLQKIVFNWAT
ncbi:MAG: ATP-binding protein [Parasphingorhabdus sp.]